MAESAKRLYLIDGYSNIFRAFYAIRNLSSSKGEPTNAVYGFVQMLRKLLRDEQPELVGVALDVSDRTFRTERFEDYKANRAPMPEDLEPQIPWIRKLLAAYRIPILELENYEADDLLGTLAKKAAAEGYEVVLVSADKDLMQLVGPRVKLFHTGRGKLYDEEAVEEDFGVPPGKVVDVLALMGDSVDNVPGVKGIGEKGARDLIRRFGSLDELLERAAEVERKSYREGLEKHRDDALLSKELVTIETGLPVDFDPEDLKHDPPDTEALKELFGELEFHSLLEEVAGLATEAAEEELGPAEEAATKAAWTKAVAKLGSPAAAVLVGGADGPRGLAVGEPEGARRFADFERRGLREAARSSLAGWLADGDCELWGHDVKELLRLAGAEEPPRARLVDLMLLAYLVKSSEREQSLEALALERLQHRAIGAKEAGFARGEEPAPGDEKLLALAGERVGLVARLAPGMLEELRSHGIDEVYRRIEEPLLPVLVRMEEAGIGLDIEFLGRMSEDLAVELEELEERIYEEAGSRFNLNSPAQLGRVMFETLGYPVRRRTKRTKSYSTDAETLEGLAAEGYPLAELVIRYRELAKLKSTYVDALPALVGEDGRLHTRFNQAVAATGRLSSTNPNLQNIPVRTGLGQRIRKAFTAAKGRVLLVADYSQVELRILAHIAGEEALIEAFQAGEDIHAATAATVFGVDRDAVTADDRRMAKVINFGILYGMSPYGLARTLGIGREEAEQFIIAYMARFPKVQGYIQETLKTAEREGGVRTLYGRIRWLPDIRSKNWNLRENARRMAINAPIQGTAADLLKLAMIAVERRLREEAPAARLLLTVHDELVLEASEAEVERVAALVKEEMEGVADLAVPLSVETGSGATWYDAKT